MEVHLIRKRIEVLEKQLCEEKEIEIEVTIVKSKDEDPATRKVIIIRGRKPPEEQPQ
jgi:hypothetical protein